MLGNSFEANSLAGLPSRFGSGGGGRAIRYVTQLTQTVNSGEYGHGQINTMESGAIVEGLKQIRRGHAFTGGILSGQQYEVFRYNGEWYLVGSGTWFVVATSQGGSSFTTFGDTITANISFPWIVGDSAFKQGDAVGLIWNQVEQFGYWVPIAAGCLPT